MEMLLLILSIMFFLIVSSMYYIVTYREKPTGLTLLALAGALVFLAALVVLGIMLVGMVTS